MFWIKLIFGIFLYLYIAGILAVICYNTSVPLQYQMLSLRLKLFRWPLSVALAFYCFGTKSFFFARFFLCCFLAALASFFSIVSSAIIIFICGFPYWTWILLNIFCSVVYIATIPKKIKQVIHREIPFPENGRF